MHRYVIYGKSHFSTLFNPWRNINFLVFKLKKKMKFPILSFDIYLMLNFRISEDFNKI